MELFEWWQRDDLRYADGGGLTFAGRDVQQLARQFQAPVFLYSTARIGANLGRLHAALDAAGFANRHQLFFAMKANRFAPLLGWLAQSGLCGIDTCSPAEILHALGCGFTDRQISMTATSLSAADFDALARHPGLHMNCDSLHALRAWGERRPGSTVGIRINPDAGVSRAANEKLQYTGTAISKFGIYREQFREALAICAHYRLQLDTIHLHAGCGYLSDQLQQWDHVLEQSHWFLDAAPGVRRVNLGGGLGVPHLPGEQPLDLQRWAGLIARHFGARGLTVQVEPGDYVVKDAGLLLLEITYDEIKQSSRFVGVNAGFAIAPEPAHYALPFQPVPLQSPAADCIPTTIAGNINEALDLWAANLPFPPLDGATHLALINAGAYAASMASNHCLRGDFREILLLERPSASHPEIAELT